MSFNLQMQPKPAARKNLNTRYTLLPYLYTFFYNHTRYGDPVLRSLKLNFPEDEGIANHCKHDLNHPIVRISGHEPAHADDRIREKKV